MIYGTHNSCTYHEPLSFFSNCAIPWIRNQTLTITEQIESGVHWFDLRVSYLDGVIYLSHTVLLSCTLDDIMQELFISDKELYINLRVDFHDLSQRDIIQPLVYAICHRYEDRIGPSKLLYSSDGSIVNPWTIPKDIMPTVSFWNKTMEEYEMALQDVEMAFQAIPAADYIYPERRMMIFDYSSAVPLCLTDMQQLRLIERYKANIMNANLWIVAGNMVQTLFTVLS